MFMSNCRTISGCLILDSVTYDGDEFVVGTKLNSNATEFVTGVVYCGKVMYERRTFNSRKKAVADIVKRIKLKLDSKINKAS